MHKLIALITLLSLLLTLCPAISAEETIAEDYLQFDYAILTFVDCDQSITIKASDLDNAQAYTDMWEYAVAFSSYELPHPEYDKTVIADHCHQGFDVLYEICIGSAACITFTDGSCRYYLCCGTDYGYNEGYALVTPYGAEYPPPDEPSWDLMMYTCQGDGVCITTWQYAPGYTPPPPPPPETEAVTEPEETTAPEPPAEDTYAEAFPTQLEPSPDCAESAATASAETEQSAETAAPREPLPQPSQKGVAMWVRREVRYRDYSGLVLFAKEMIRTPLTETFMDESLGRIKHA